jgi:hypothetical protein
LKAEIRWRNHAAASSIGSSPLRNAEPIDLIDPALSKRSTSCNFSNLCTDPDYRATFAG